MAAYRHGDYIQYFHACAEVETCELPILIWHMERSHCLAISQEAMEQYGNEWDDLSSYSLWSDRTPDVLYYDLRGNDNLYITLHFTTAQKDEFTIQGQAFYPLRSDGGMVLHTPVLAVWVGEELPNEACEGFMRNLARQLVDPQLPQHMVLPEESLTQESASTMLDGYKGLVCIKDLDGHLVAGTSEFVRHVSILQNQQAAGIDVQLPLVDDTTSLSQSLDQETLKRDNLVPYTMPNRRVADMIHEWRSELRFPLHNVNGDTVGLFVVLRLFEDNEAIALEYDYVQRYFQVLHDTSDALECVLIVWSANGADALEYVSKSVYEWGLSPVDMASMSQWAALVHPEDRARFADAHMDMLEDPHAGGYVSYRIVIATGETRRVHEEVICYADPVHTPWMCSTIRFAEEDSDHWKIHQQNELNRMMRYEIEAKQERDAMLSVLYHDLNHASDLDSYMQQTLTLVAKQFQLTVGLVWEINDNKLSLTNLYEDKQLVSVPSPLPLPSLQDVRNAAQAMQSNDLIRVDDVDVLPVIWKDIICLVGAKQLFWAPMGHQNSYYGVLCFFDVTKRHWLNEDSRSLTQFAQMLASVMFRKRMQANLMQIAYQDPILQIPNRQALERDLVPLLDAKREGMLFLLDLGNLKMVRNAYGMEQGDALLIAVRDYIKTSGQQPYWFSNDEFAVILEGWTEEQVSEWADTFMKRFGTAWSIEDKQVFLAANGGVASLQVDTVMELLQQADAARMSASTNETLWMMYNGSQREVLFQVELAKDMHQAIGNDCAGFVVYYQPIFDLQSHQFLHAEALLRWQHPEHGLLMPSHFMDIAEETGLIIPLTHFVLCEALAQVREWQRRWPEFAVTVNLSRRQVRERNTVSMVADCLAQANVSPSSLIVELTETKAIQDISSTIELFCGLRELGVRVALDDFGVGLSSLSAINALPIDIIKVDKSFVQQGTEYDQQVMAFVAQVAHSKGIWMCTEGVETPLQWNMTAQQGSTHIQGYLISEPVPARQAEAVIDQWQPGMEWCAS